MATKPKLEKLKPCPFCGGKAKRNDVSASKSEMLFVTRCSAPNPCSVFPCAVEETRAAADAAWNRRFEAPIFTSGKGKVAP